MYTWKFISETTREQENGHFYYINLAYPRTWDVFPFSAIFFNSFLQSLKFLSKRSFTSLVHVRSRYFILFLVAVIGDVSLIFLSVCLSFVYRMTTKFLELILCHFSALKILNSCRSFQVEYWGSLIYTITSSAHNENLISFFLSNLIQFNLLLLSYF